jgi:hypothetical protein
MGPVWKDVVDLWWALEEIWKFALSVSSLFSNIGGVLNLHFR